MAKSNNSALHAATKNKEDEFYTQLTDIEKELKHYKLQFKDKVIFCNCDDPDWSNFWKYFELNFKHLGTFVERSARSPDIVHEKHGLSLDRNSSVNVVNAENVARAQSRAEAVLNARIVKSDKRVTVFNAEFFS